jgi:hypothetical protein
VLAKETGAGDQRTVEKSAAVSLISWNYPRVCRDLLMVGVASSWQSAKLWQDCAIREYSRRPSSSLAAWCFHV